MLFACDDEVTPKAFMYTAPFCTPGLTNLLAGRLSALYAWTAAQSSFNDRHYMHEINVLLRSAQIVQDVVSL